LVKLAQVVRDTCAGYVRHVTHDEIADAIGWNLREVPGTPANLISKGKGDNSMPRKRAKSESVVA
jgi:hypothetical protein